MTTDDGLKGEVSSVDVLRQKVRVVVEVDGEKEARDYGVEELRFKKRHRKGKGKNDIKEEESAELLELEKD